MSLSPLIVFSFALRKNGLHRASIAEVALDITSDQFRLQGTEVEQQCGGKDATSYWKSINFNGARTLRYNYNKVIL